MNAEPRPGLYSPESAEQYEAQLLDMARTALATDELLALANLFLMVEGYANHLRDGMAAAGIDAEDAEAQGWGAAWRKMRDVLDGESTTLTHEVATTMERQLSVLYGHTHVSDAGEPLDPVTRGFYKVFKGRTDYPGVSSTAVWLNE